MEVDPRLEDPRIDWGTVWRVMSVYQLRRMEALFECLPEGLRDPQKMLVAHAMSTGWTEGNPMDASAVAAYARVSVQTALRVFRQWEEHGFVTITREGRRVIPMPTKKAEAVSISMLKRDLTVVLKVLPELRKSIPTWP